MSYYKYNGVQSPPRRPIIQPSALSPFSTSPSQLQEVTLDPDGPNNYTAGGFHSPNGGPMRGRSIKEFEESLTALRKENFNLKLRIYFLEERMGTNFCMDKENAIKKNIELKVEVESLKKELVEKQELLCQAVKAMELDEEEHKKDTEDNQKKIKSLQKELDSLQQKLEDEVRCQGDHAYNEDKEYYERALFFQSKECNHESYIQELETKVKEFETMLSNEKSNIRELENLLQLSDNRNANIAALEEEVKEKDSTIKKLQSDVEERNKIVSNYRIRVNNLEDNIIEKKNDIDYVSKELKDKCLLIQDLQRETEELQKLVTETQTNLSLERRKNDKHKISVHDRNKRIMELEDEVTQLTKKLSSVQTQFEAALKSEVQRKNDKLQAPSKVCEPAKGTIACGDEHVPTPLPQLKLTTSLSTPVHDKLISNKCRSPGESSSANIVNAIHPVDLKDLNLDQLQKEVVKSKRHIMKLEQDQLKACKIIQSMLGVRKKNTKEIDELRVLISRKDVEIEQLSEQISKYCKNGDGLKLMTASQSKTVTKVSDIPIDHPSTDNETLPAEDSEDPKLLLDQYKELTDNLEEQKQVLICTLEETRNQLEELESKYETIKNELKTKENTIVDLEFEVLTLAQGINNDCSMGEKSDVGNEKPAAFFVQEIDEKDREIEKLENELRKRTCDLQGIVNRELWEKNREIEKLQKKHNEIVAEKDQEIIKLEDVLNNTTQQLELLKRNIFELGMSVQDSDHSIQIIKRENEELIALEDKLSTYMKERDFFKQQLDDYDSKLRIASQKAIADSEKLNQLKKDYSQAREDFQKCDQLRLDANEVCSVLCRRLQELAYFLDSLLKQKSVLGHLGLKKNGKLRLLINQTLDISKNISLSMSMNPDQSLLQLSNISAVLNATENLSILEDIDGDLEQTDLSLVPGDVSLIYQSHYCQTDSSAAEDARVIGVLRAQVENLKKEIELRDIELSKLSCGKSDGEQITRLSVAKTDISPIKDGVNKLSVVKVDNVDKADEDIMDVIMAIAPEPRGGAQTQQQIFDTLVCTKFSNLSSEKSTTTLKFNWEQNSESESWSEPDRDVSKARIGLEDSFTPRKGKDEILSTEEDQQRNSQTRISSRKSILAENRQTIIALHEQICDMEEKLKEKDSELQRTIESFKDTSKLLENEKEKVSQFLRQRDELFEKISQTEKKLEAAEKAKSAANEHMVELQKTIEDVKTSQKILQDTMEIKNKETQNKMNKLELEKSELLEQLMQAEQLAIEVRMKQEGSQTELKLLRQELEYIDQTVRDEVKAECEQRLKTQEQNYEIKIKLMEHTAEAQINKINDAHQELQSKYDAECRKRLEVEKFVGTIKELERFKKVVKAAEDRILSMEETEKKLKHQLQEAQIEHRAKLNSLREELEKANLTYSESVLEKSRILTEKQDLECQLKEFASKEGEFSRQVREYKDDFANMKETFQKQVAHLEHQKSKLEVRIGELEQANAELKNKLIKLQAGDVQSPKPAHSSTTSRILELFLNKTVPGSYRRQHSENSEYSDEQSEFSRTQPTAFHHPTVDAPLLDLDRQHANSSPDLGIESDHGRFSSLEAHVNMNRPFLRTLELTESMSNLLSRQDNQILMCNNEMCCQKTKEIVNENNDLRKKLMRTRRALDDTVGQLQLANQKKKQVEKTICKQIYKTSQVLRKAKTNLDTGSDTDMLSK